LPGIQDTQCGFKVFTAAAAQEIFSRCVIDQFAFDMEALYVARCLGYTIAEVPIRWSHKPGSKYNAVRDSPKAFADLCAIRWIHRSLPAINPTTTSSPSA
jgi:dolichyl-phosphate beta-glucosyltransferase